MVGCDNRMLKKIFYFCEEKDSESSDCILSCPYFHIIQKKKDRRLEMTINDTGRENPRDRVWDNAALEAPTSRPQATDFVIEEHPIDEPRSLKVACFCAIRERSSWLMGAGRYYWSWNLWDSRRFSVACQGAGYRSDHL